MPVNLASTVRETTYDISNAGFLLIGLPDKVYLPAEKAEELSWDILTQYVGVWPRLIASQAGALGSTAYVGNSLVTEFAANSVIARTYLTYGWKYKHRMARNLLSEEVKQIALDTDLPRYVWVTEFGTVNSLSHSDYDKMRIFSHCVIDATGKNMQADSRLLFHAPGIVVRLAIDPKAQSTAPSYKRDQFLIKDDLDYRPKRRGQMDFA